jgi:uncharacterized protein (DUF58 family)
LYFNHPNLAREPSGIVTVVYLGTGLILILWGAVSLLRDLIGLFGDLRRQPARHYQVRMPREALIYFMILLVLCAGALMGRSNMLMLVFGLMAGPFILNGQITLLIVNRLGVTRSLPERAVVGQRFSVKLALTNRKRVLSSWMVSAEDLVQTPNEQLQPAVLFACVPPRATREAAYQILPARRGLYEFGPVRVMSRFPLGLVERSFELGEVEQLVVYPRVGRLEPGWHRRADTGSTVSNQLVTGSGSGDDEFQRLREYRTGDNTRDIHWRTSARRSELMVREYQHTRRRDLLLVIDLWLPQRAQPRDVERVELAISFAASICVDHLQAATDSAVELVVCGPRVWRAAAGSQIASLDGLLETLALVQPAGHDPRYDRGHDKSLESLSAELQTVATEAAHAMRAVLLTTRRRKLLEGVLARGAGDMEIIECDPTVISGYLTYDDGLSASGPSGGPVRESPEISL